MAVQALDSAGHVLGTSQTVAVISYAASLPGRRAVRMSDAGAASRDERLLGSWQAGGSVGRLGACACAVVVLVGRCSSPLVVVEVELLALPPHPATATVAARTASSVSMAVSGVRLMGRAPIVARGLGALTLPGVRGATSQLARRTRRERRGDRRARASAEVDPRPSASGLALGVAAGRVLRGAVHGHPRPEHRQRGAALDPVEPRLLLARPAVGRRRVRDHVRRLPDARRPRGRPLRAAADVRRRAGPVRAHLAGRRRRRRTGDADRRPRACRASAAR